MREARTWLGTPFHHAARVKGVGVDCLGLVAALADQFGIEHGWSQYGYGQDNILTLIGHLEGPCVRVSEIEAGDVLLFRVEGRMPHHIGIYTGEQSFIHAYDAASVRRVVETPLSTKWTKRIHSMWRLRGVVSSQASF